jgi:ankyrin repeat protein
MPPSLAVPDPVDDDGKTPLCTAGSKGNAMVTLALLDGGANIDFATPRTPARDAAVWPSP